MPVPVVSTAPGPDWATDLNACLSVIDGHNHASGQGVQITPAGISINADFPMNGNNITTIRSLRMTSQGAALILASDLDCLYTVLGDLYYNDGNGNNIRITQTGSVTGSAGTITGLPSGTAGASFSGGTFTFIAATNTPAAMAVGPVSIGNSSAGAKTVTLAPDVSIASNYSLTFPAALPGASNYVTLDNTGALLYNTAGKTGTGAVVLATSPAIATPTLTGNVPAFQALGLSVYPALNVLSTSAKVGGTLYVGAGTATNTGTGETTLYTYTLPANSLLTGDTLDISYSCVLTTNANVKTLKIYLGTSNIAVISSQNSGGYQSGIVTIRRTGANNQLMTTQIGYTSTGIGASPAYLVTSETDSSAMIIKITGQSDTTSSDLTCNLFRINYVPGP